MISLSIKFNQYFRKVLRGSVNQFGITYLSSFRNWHHFGKSKISSAHTDTDTHMNSIWNILMHFNSIIKLICFCLSGNCRKIPPNMQIRHHFHYSRFGWWPRIAAEDAPHTAKAWGLKRNRFISPWFIFNKIHMILYYVCLYEFG